MTNNIPYNKETDLISQLTQMQKDYYEKTGKNTFFKKSQKVGCAESISNSCDIDKLIRHSLYIIPNTNKIYMDYLVFKTYATPQNYVYIAQQIIILFDKCIDEYNDYEVHVNLDTLTISGCERNKNILSVITEQTLNGKREYANILNKLYIYNPPSIMDTVFRIARPYMNPIIMQKVILYSKKDSGLHIHTLFQSMH